MCLRSSILLYCHSHESIWKDSKNKLGVEVSTLGNKQRKKVEEIIISTHSFKVLCKKFNKISSKALLCSLLWKALVLNRVFLFS